MDYTEIGSRRMVEVVEYDPTWPDKFAQERESLAHAIPDALAIEHIGSTSVSGLCAKPTLDILIVVLHVLTQDSPRPNEYLLLRDYLRADASAVGEYAQVKRDLAAQYATRRDRYVAEKSDYVTELMSKAREWRLR